MCLSQGDSWEDWKVSDEQAAPAMTDVIISNPTWRSGPEKRLWGHSRAKSCWPQVTLLGGNQESCLRWEGNNKKGRNFQGTEPDVQSCSDGCGARHGWTQESRGGQVGLGLNAFFSHEVEAWFGWTWFSGDLRAFFPISRCGGDLVAKLCLTLATPWTVARQAPLSMGFSRQDYSSGLPFPSPGELPDPGIKPGSPALQADDLPTELWRSI